MATKKNDRGNTTMPLLQRLSQSEATCATNAFKLYDYNSTGRIPFHLAKKLLHTLGMTCNDEILINIIGSHPEVTLYDFLTALDKLMPEPEPILMSSLDSFNSFAAKEVENPNQPDTIMKVVDPQSIAKFMESLGRPPINMNEATLMLNAMLEYDDCSEIPLVTTEIFNKELINFAKKTNAFKDYRG